MEMGAIAATMKSNKNFKCSSIDGKAQFTKKKKKN